MHYFGIMPNRSDMDNALNLLYSTAGFHKLSEYQQHLMTGAIRIQHRFDRHLSKNRKGYNYKYHKSWEFLTGINCHRSAYSIEQETGYKNTPLYIPDSFFLNDRPEYYCYIYFQAFARVLLADSPCIVHINRRKDDFAPTHTFIALGWSNQVKDIVAWEKMGNSYPYRVTGMKQIHKEYPGNYWIARPFQTPR